MHNNKINSESRLEKSRMKLLDYTNAPFKNDCIFSLIYGWVVDVFYPKVIDVHIYHWSKVLFSDIQLPR